ncbi:MAG TPA: HYR domain-containing protein [Steroidobacteraceae bacterium]|nr:HYR domain-containing protein [Steroidobacteraceae bacterium]
MTVRDTTPPALSVPANIVASTSGTTATVTYQVTATDNVGVTALACTSTAPGVTSGDLTKGGSFPKGTSTVACTATDAAGNVAAKSFTVTVNTAPYGGLDGVYASGSKSINSSVPLDFGFTGSNGGRVDSSLAQPLVKVYSSGKTCVAGTLGALIASFPGSSDYRYSASSLNWQFNWKTTGLTTGCYNITVTSVQTGQTFVSRNSVTLTK